MVDINLYCDESGHLENDRNRVMVLGVLACPADRVQRTARDLRAIKKRHGMGHGHPERFEVKWSKVSPGGLPFYREYLDYFFDSEDLDFRALVVPDKARLRHAEFEQTHDDWYYKMFYQALSPLLDSGNRYRVYLDIKDTLSQRKVEHLRAVLSNKLLDFDRTIVARVQHVRSNEVEHVQLADLLMGAVAYKNRGLYGNSAKEALVRQVQERSGLTLRFSTGKHRRKFNLFVWEPREAADA